MTAAAGTPAPPVLRWHRVYCGLMAALYAACVAMGMAFIYFSDRLADSDNPAGFFLFMGALWIVLGLALAALFAAAFVIPPRPWAWIFHLVLICIGLSSPCCLPVCVPLLIYWLKPETRTYFGREL
jgi:MFS family permease